MAIREGDLCFEFGANWNTTARRLEGHPDYERIKGFGVDTVDFIGIYSDTLYFIEVKDYRTVHHERDVLAPRELSEWIANKFQGTLLCFYLSSNRYKSNAWNDFLSILSDETKNVQLVMWIEIGDLSTIPAHRLIELHRKRALKSVLMATLKSRFGEWRKNDPNINWPIVIFTNSAHNLPDLTVTDLRVSPVPCP